jgi:hypothetical protein
MSSYILRAKNKEQDIDILESPLISESAEGCISILELDRHYSESVMSTELTLSYCGCHLKQVCVTDKLILIKKGLLLNLTSLDNIVLASSNERILVLVPKVRTENSIQFDKLVIRGLQLELHPHCQKVWRKTNHLLLKRFFLLLPQIPQLLCV